MDQAFHRTHDDARAQVRVGHIRIGESESPNRAFARILNITMKLNGLQYWDRHARNYDRSMRVLGGPMPRMLELVAASVRGAREVLEVAAGTGIVTQRIAAEAPRIVATDYAPAMVQALRERVTANALANVEVLQADLYALPFAEQAFDAVVAANVLHLLPDLSAAFAAMRRVLRPGGKLILPTFCHDESAVSWTVSRVLALTGFPGHRRFTFASLRAALAQHGLQEISVELIPGVIPIAHVAARI